MDYNSIIRTVLRMIKEKTGHVVIEANGTGKQPEYPFCTYTVTSPYLPQHRGVEEQGVLTEDIELVFSFTWISNSHIEVISLAQETASYFKTADARQTLHDNGMAWVRNDGFGNRDTFITIDTERRHGFDMRLRTRSAYGETQAEFFDSAKIETIGG
ncbi:LIC_12616 family protein [Bacillus amyloliquefaciens]|uniref:phage neck terminator protein n=1 Tax=Bacillus amyloliquefaciens TaxID=1390 RepID=UPI002FF70C82